MGRSASGDRQAGGPSHPRTRVDGSALTAGGPRQKTLPTTRRVARQGKRQKALGLGLDAPKRIDLGWGRSPSPEQSGGQPGPRSEDRQVKLGSGLPAA